MSIILFLVIPVMVVFLPFLANQNLLLNRNNDLTEFFWPIFYYVKENILNNHQIPYFNNIFFAGTPLLPDPQNPIWYLPNAIFLITNIDTGILISLIAHSLLGSTGAYLVSKHVFKFTKTTSLVMASVFTLSPQLFSYLEAGHWGLFIAWNWLPYLFLSSYKLASKPTKIFVFLFAVSASSIFFNHIVTAFIIALPIALYWLYKKPSRYIILASIITLMIISPALMAQLKWQPDTTRDLLLTHPEVFPIWRGKSDFIKSIFVFNKETEKAITFGIIPSAVAGIGFLSLKRKKKILFGLLFFFLTLIVLNNVSPILPILLKIKFYVLARVSIRVWVLAIFPFLYLFGLGLEKMNKKIIPIIGILAAVELASIGYQYIQKPVSERVDIPSEIYEILTNDKEDFRVFCLSRCIPQKKAAVYNLHLVEGYGTLPEKKYFNILQNALNTKWDKYTLSVPPFEAYLYEELQPNADLLLTFNTKYVISKYTLTDENFLLLGKFGEYYTYINTLWR